jgi:subtilisin family serine protease/subtilisin-like proprotein convertase family protein
MKITILKMAVLLIFVNSQPTFSASKKRIAKKKEDKSKNAALKKEKESLLRKKATLNQLIKNTQNQNATLQSESVRLKNELNLLKSEYEGLKKEYNLIESTNLILERIENDYNSKANPIIKEINDLSQKNISLAKEIEETRSLHEEKISFLTDLNHFIQILKEPEPVTSHIEVLEDVSFKMNLPFKKELGFTIGLLNAPSWLKLDLESHQIYGTPWNENSIKEQEQFQIKVFHKQFQKTIGPFSLNLKRNDPLNTFAWHLKNKGQKTFASNPGVQGEDIHLNQTIASNILGQNIRVAVSDTGVEDTHEDLKDSMLPLSESRNYNHNNEEEWRGSSQYEGMHHHGTSVAGIIAATGWNKKGLRGIAPMAKLAGFSFLCSGCQSYSTILDQTLAKNFDIFNYSYGYSQCSLIPLSGFVKESLQHQVSFGREGKGVLFVKSAGNDFRGYLSDCHSSYQDQFDSRYYSGNSNFDGMNTTPYIIVVGALRANGKKSSYSSPGSNLWISAPGGEYGYNFPAILTTNLSGVGRGAPFNYFYDKGHPDYDPDGNYTAIMNGTSSAAPVMSGSLALILSANPNLTWREIKHIIAKTADKVQPDDNGGDHPLGKNLKGHLYRKGWLTNAAGYSFNNSYGFGRINVDKAIEMAKNYTREFSPLTQKEHTKLELSLPVQDNSSTGALIEIEDHSNLTIESVQLELNADHTRASDFGLEITSPSGTKSILLPINSHISNTSIEGHTFLTNAFYEESSNGLWKIKVIDGKAEHSGTVQSIKLKIWGH